MLARKEWAWGNIMRERDKEALGVFEVVLCDAV